MKGKTPSYTSLSNKQRYITLIYLVGIPYLKSKLDELYKELVPLSNFSIIEEYNPEVEQNPQKKTFTATLRRMLLISFTYGYPFFNAIYEGAFFLYQLLYLYDYTIYFSPFHHMQGLTLKRLSLNEMKAQSSQNEDRRNKRLNSLQGGPLPTIWKWIVHYYDLALDYSKLLLPISLFLYRFLEWWFADNRVGTESRPIPPPPEPLKRSADGLEIPADKSVCPICKNPRTNPALLASSGYVFCYPCIFNYVKEYEQCPITRQPSETDQVRKIYETI